MNFKKSYIETDEFDPLVECPVLHHFGQGRPFRPLTQNRDTAVRRCVDKQVHKPIEPLLIGKAAGGNKTRAFTRRAIRCRRGILNGLNIDRVRNHDQLRIRPTRIRREFVGDELRRANDSSDSLVRCVRHDEPWLRRTRGAAR